MGARLGAVNQPSNVLLVAQYIVQAVLAKGFAALGGAALAGELVHDGVIAGPGRVHLKNQPHGLCFVLVDDVPFGDIHVIPQGRRTAAGLPLAGHKAHLLDDLLPRDQDVHLVEQRHCAFVDKDGRV